MSTEIPSTDGHLEPADLTDTPLTLAGFEGTPEEVERQWFEQVYAEMIVDMRSSPRITRATLCWPQDCARTHGMPN